MPLPVVITPTHETILPSSGKSIKFRPFLVGEEKILLIALEEGTEEAFVDSIKTILERVIITPNVDLDNLPMVDIEHLFIQLRKHSVGSVIEMKYSCRNILTKDNISKPCGHEILVDIPIDDIKVENLGAETTIMLHDDIGAVLKYPKFKTLQKIMKLDSNNTEEIFALIGESVESLFDNDHVYRDFSKDEWENFLNSLPGNCLDKFLNFITNTPYHFYKTSFKCEKCGNTGDLEYKGLNDFFE